MMFLRRSGVRRAVAVAVTGLAVAVGPGCAGDVGKYRNATGASVEAAGDDGLSTALDGSAAVAGEAGDAVGRSSTGSAGGPAGGPTRNQGQSTSGAPGAAAPAAPLRASAGSRIGVTPTQVTVGMLMPTSGPYAGLTRNFPAVVNAAFAEVNEQGGIHGRRLVLQIYDDAGSNAETVTANERRARSQVLALMSVVSTTSDIAAPLAEQDGLPFFATTMAGDLGTKLRFSFVGEPFWTTQARILPGFIANRLNARQKKIGVVFEGTEPARQAKDVFKSEAARAGISVAFEQPTAVNQASCANEVSNLQSRGIEVAVLINGPLGAICMLRDSRAIGYRPLFTGFGSMWGVGAVATASGGGADGISLLGSATTLETPGGQRYQAIVRKHAPNTGAESDDANLKPFALAQLVIEAIRRAGPDLTREAVIDAMEMRISGFESGFLPPPRYGVGDRRGPQSVAVIRCCTQNRWTTVDPAYRESF
jgi:ABC-type branched-subunit amino acid transport system substrate-binding protein